MFTGLIEQRSRVLNISDNGSETRIEIETGKFDDIAGGDSIAVNGVCLTAHDISGQSFKVTMINETKRITSLGNINAGEEVNLERAMQLSDRLGGHLQSGHVDGTGIVENITRDGSAVIMEIRCPGHLMKYMSHKGSVAIDGTSLTLFEVKEDEETIVLNLIPETLERTVLSAKKIHDPVNIEADQIIKHVEQLLRRGAVPSFARGGGLNV